MDKEVISLQDIERITYEVIERFVIPDFLERGHNASGDWVANVGVRAELNKGVITGPDYTGTLTDGRGPNKDQDPVAISNWARWYGQNVFQPWSDAKGIGINPYAVAYTIARTGTKIYKEGGSDFLKILQTEEVRKFILDRISSIVIVNVKDILKESIDKLKRA